MSRTDKTEKLLNKYPSLKINEKELSDSIDLIISCYKNGGKILVCGNGGSAADSEHIVGELMKGFNKKRPLDEKEKQLFGEDSAGIYISSHLQNALPAISLVSQSGLITAFANDVDSNLVFAQQVWGYGKKGDILLALSTSGNSKNVFFAAKTASALGIKTIAVTGKKESLLSDFCDITLRLDALTPQTVQELTLPVYHFLCDAVEDELFAE